MTGITVEELVVPAALDGSSDAVAFEQAVEARNAAEAASWGTTDYNYSAAALLPGWQDQEHEPARLFGVRVDSRVVARGGYEWHPEGDPGAVWLTVQVHPGHRGRGIGGALLRHLEALAIAEGRRKLLVFSDSRPWAPGDTEVIPPTGAGRLPAEAPEVRFALAHGFRLEQIERGSRLDLPVRGLGDLHAAAVTAAGADYRVRTMTNGVPADRREDVAALLTRMYTDAPSAGMEVAEEVWTPERLADYEADQLASFQAWLVAVVEHAPSGRLVAFTELQVPDDISRPVDQGDTIVLREHRGHRLGMLVKTANLLALERQHPGARSVVTFNAEENRHMLDVNEAIGFRGIVVSGGWRKDL